MSGLFNGHKSNACNPENNKDIVLIVMYANVNLHLFYNSVYFYC